MFRLIPRTIQVVIDLVILVLAFWLAFWLRFESAVPDQMFKRLLFLWPYTIALQFSVLVALGVPRFSWRYFGLRETTRVGAALGVTSAALVLIRLAAVSFFDITGSAQYAVIPVGIILIDLLLAFLGISGVRVFRRMQVEWAESRSRHRTGPRVPTMLVGAGQAGLLVAKEIGNRADLGILAVGFIDDDRGKHGTVLHGIPVLGSTKDLRALCVRHGATQVLITISNASGTQIRGIKALCDAAEVPAKILPGIYEIVGGQVNLSRIRSVTIEDLLGREAVVLETAAIGQSLSERIVVITGAGGSIGSELGRQICHYRPAKLVLVEQAENALFHIHRELVDLYPERAASIIPCIGDICDRTRIERIFAEHSPHIVFHAAAHKHVPMMEWNPGEAIRNNLLGSKTVADVAHAAGVEQFVMVSTDKAVNPTSVMGASKRVAEIYIQALSERSQTRFVTVRFGNVLGSAGSVIPIFQEQIARGGPVTVTHPEMKRYFMTIPEACQLVMQAGAMGQGGEIFILDMGEPVKIVDLARDLISLSGLRPGDDIEIQFTGIRPGEKLFEELSVADETVDKTRHPKIFVGRFRRYPWEDVTQGVADLEKLTIASPESIREKLKQILPEYNGVPWTEVDPVFRIRGSGDQGIR
jgi:FlaA1/EpsC-like NDP-sugar epimerase